MVKVIGLAVAVFACWTCAPAQAGVPSVNAPSVAVPQPVQDVVGEVAPAATKVTESARDHSAPTGPSLRAAAAGATAPAATIAVAKTTVQVAQGRAGDSGGLRVGASSLRRVPSARLRRAAPPRERTAPARSEPRPETGPAPLAHPAPAPADAHAPVARSERQSPPNPVPAPRADGGISAGASALFAGGLGMLAGALIVMAPRLRRRLSIDRAALRPVAFVALLERPG